MTPIEVIYAHTFKTMSAEVTDSLVRSPPPSRGQIEEVSGTQNKTKKKVANASGSRAHTCARGTVTALPNSGNWLSGKRVGNTVALIRPAPANRYTPVRQRI